MNKPKRKRIERVTDVDYGALMDYTYCYRCGDIYSGAIEADKHVYQLMLARGYDMWEQALIEKAWNNLESGS